MISTKSALEILRALRRRKESYVCTWEKVAEDMKVNERTLYNALAWCNGKGKRGHRPNLETLRAAATWLRGHGVFITIT